MTAEETPQAEERAARPAKIRTSITIRPDYLEKAKERGPSVSGVIDSALEAYFGDGVVEVPLGG